MTEISASMVKELREKTGAGMMDCKTALSQTGSMDGAIKFLREKGLAKAAKKTDRVAAEGVIALQVEGGRATMVELNSETDFVARNQDFLNLATNLAKTAMKFATADAGIFEGSALDNETLVGASSSVASTIVEKIATIGEKITLRRFAALTGGAIYGSYLHSNASIGVLVECGLNDAKHLNAPEVAQAAKDVAMHVAASNPPFIREQEIDKDWVEGERNIFKTQLIAQGKPENMVDKILEGKMKKHMADHCLLGQPFVKNPDVTVQQMLDEVKAKTGAEILVKRMVRFKVGEGLAKKEDNFAEEVAKMTA
jgi:elongation factor Ts